MNCVKIRIHNLLSSAIHLIHSNIENSIKNKNKWAQNIKDYIENTKKLKVLCSKFEAQLDQMNQKTSHSLLQRR